MEVVGLDFNAIITVLERVDRPGTRDSNSLREQKGALRSNSSLDDPHMVRFRDLGFRVLLFPKGVSWHLSQSWDSFPVLSHVIIPC